MDKNTVTGILLIAAIFIGSMVYNSKQAEKQKALHPTQQVTSTPKVDSASVMQPQTPQKAKNEEDEHSFFAETKATDSIPTVGNTLDSVSNSAAQIVSLENSKIKIDFSTKGGQMIKAHLKGFKTFQGDSLYLFDSDMNFALLLQRKNNKQLNTADSYFTPIKTDSTLTMRLGSFPTKYIDFIYTLASNPKSEGDNYMLKFDIRAVGMKDILSRESLDKFNLLWSQSLKSKEKYLKGEERYSKLQYKVKNEDGNIDGLSESKDDSKEESTVKWIAFKDQFFATSLIADEGFDYIDVKSVVNSNLKPHEPVQYLKNFSAKLIVPVIAENDGSLKVGFRYFLGPLNYKMLQSYDKNINDSAQTLSFDKLIPLGWSLFRLINQYFIIPIFNLLSTSGWNMGIVILLLTLIVKLIISPLTFKSFMSSAKMRVLKPEIDELTKQYPDATERQKATMALYSKAGVNPMSGCVPMLLQTPILYAMFEFFPSAIQLRQQSFLWATDLSTYDVIFQWHKDIPYLSNLMGNHISLFCVLMSLTNVVYTKFQQDAQGGQQQMPGMKWMMYLMPVVFMFVLNNYSSGLTFYYFISTLITILLTIGFRFAVNEEKLLAKLQENKKKPKKKSGFMARLEEAQRTQQQQKKGGAKPVSKKR